MTRFHDLTVAHIDRQTPDAMTIAFELAPNHRDTFNFVPGQYLTLAANVDGEEVRRSYSICSEPGEGELRVGVKRVEGGRLSSWLHENLKPGDTIRVMQPEGRFTALIGGSHDYLLIAAGSGITPMLSIARTVLGHEPESTVTLVYGNRTMNDIMFREDLDDLKDRYLQRFSLVHVLSREQQDVEILNGRIDGERIIAMADHHLIDPWSADGIFLCGPGAMIDDVAKALEARGVSPDRIRSERFTVEGEAPRASPPSEKVKKAAKAGVAVEVVLDGARKSFSMSNPEQSVLDAAHEAGIELPYSCAGGMCCTCRCRIVEGGTEMAVNYSLQPWEVEAGFTLACQSRPTSEKLVLDFDAV